MNWGYGHKKENIPEEMLTSETPKLVSAEFVGRVHAEMAVADVI
jgi:hypothetical protein